MNVDVYPYKVGDLIPPLEVQLWAPPSSPGAPALPADITGADSAVIRIRSIKTGLMLVDDQDADIVAGGKVQYQWQSMDEQEVGLQEGEVTLTYPDGNEITYPPDGYFLLRGVARLE